jgi:hypothetical protein
LIKSPQYPLLTLIVLFLLSHLLHTIRGPTNIRLSKWHDVDNIATYPAMRILRLSHIPLFEGRGSSEIRPEVIARIKQLTFFNGSHISPRERVESEKNYLRGIQYARAAAAAATATNHGASASASVPTDLPPVDPLQHPRYAELMQLYGADLVPASKALAGPSNMAAEMVSVTFKNLSFGSNGSLEPVTKKLPRSLTIARLQLLVKQLFGLDPRLQFLSMRVHKDAPPSPMDDEKASLQYYGAVDGAEIFINEGKA